jgi:hypothetical protein
MSELAFNVNGEAFEVPETAAGWKVKRMKAKGAPEVVYGRNGMPLVLARDAGIDDLKSEVDQPGRYRLDLVDDNNKPLEGIGAGYVHVHTVAPAAESTPRGATITTPSSDATIEAMRLNSELARSVIDRFPQMMEAAAVLLRAADGAGLPSREPRVEADDDEQADAPVVSPTFELINNLVAQIVPIIVTTLASKGTPKLGAVLDWRKAKPTIDAPVASAPAPAAPMEPPSLEPAVLAKVMQLQASLTPTEQTRARMLAAELSPTELREWFAELSALDVPAALAKIRSVIGGGQ